MTWGGIDRFSQKERSFRYRCNHTSKASGKDIPILRKNVAYVCWLGIKLRSDGILAFQMKIVVTLPVLARLCFLVDTVAA